MQLGPHITLLTGNDMWIRFIVVVELVIGFGIAFYMWVLGLIAFPFTLIAMFSGAGIEALPLMIAVVFGGFGLWGLMQLVIKLFDPKFGMAKPKLIWLYLVLGLIAFVIVIGYVKINLVYSFAIFGPPLLVTSHLVYLKRDVLLYAS